MENPHKDFDYSKAGKELKKLLMQIATVKVNNKRKGIVYNGPDIKSSSILSIDSSIKDTFSDAQLPKRLEQRTKLDLFINKVYQLGYSVGMEEMKSRSTLVDDLLKELKKDIKKKKK